ncbi:hypothetical protein DOTSEDRAFT_68407 [Dothistroma septosporum NZE10]|uniref:PHD-type domain-containing protein n=1 Tax=Dothistroma septosporum (strain NZE10 / CBS 128990) TaxID=675120 RepID=N1Q1L2_DOTSN|nr:hypothetical protein DOTSEDRAFT_68407 [Dothistroma septosporum NZE10]
MAAAEMSPRRAQAQRTPGRQQRALASIEPSTEPPPKRRKFLPGGPGGGGRYIDEHGHELSKEQVEAEGLRTMSRSRPRRATSHADRSLRVAVTDTPLVTRSAVRPSSSMTTRPRRERERPERYQPQPATPRPRYSSAAAAAAASQASDGYKPREERSWEEFHPDLGLDAGLLLYTADEVDGRTSRYDPKLHALNIRGFDGKSFTNADFDVKDAPEEVEQPPHGSPALSPLKRKPGRPPRRPEAMLSGLGSPPAPRIMPLPTHNPKERLNLPKPSFRHYNHFLQYEEDQRENKVNYVDRTMAHVGYQETDRYELLPTALIRLSEGQQADDEAEVSLRLESDGALSGGQAGVVVSRVEYDMDEQDVAWLDDINQQRKAELQVDAIKPAIFEITMTQIEKEYHALEKRIPKPQPRHAQTHRPRSSSQAAVNGDPNPPGEEPDSKCSICDDGDCENANAIIFCDGCDLAVHQECYGVPFIPEGQWFCRKCKEIGRGTPTCIFCPNVDGAFKQTSTLRWSHLLCTIWIPEVSIANTTFMEPIQDVDKVPKSRWRLTCYICNQKMGACIQCGNKNCYQAFHVTCARRAKLFLKMKSQNQQGIDHTALKAFCDRHVPQDWRRAHDTEHATIEAKRWYKHAFKDRKWADSQSDAQALGAPPPPDGGLGGDTTEDTIAVTPGAGRRKKQSSKSSWKLPSGAPVVPAVVFNAVEASLARFTVRKRKEFVERACRYWTLKREARRGAALLKRLQLQLESFSSMEVTRRNFAGMGAAGLPRLKRRISFAKMLQKDMHYLKDLTAHVRQREELRLREIELLRELVDTVYFPIPPLLWPILRRAQKLDEKSRVFRSGFEILEQRLHERHYTSVADFSQDFSRVVGQALASRENVDLDSDAGIDNIHAQLLENKPGTAEHMALTQEQKDLKRVAKRVLKPVRELLEEATRKEAQLRGLELEEELRKLDSMGLFASAATRELDVDGDEEVESVDRRRTASDASAVADDAVVHLNVAGKEDTIPILDDKTATGSKAVGYASSIPDHSSKTRNDNPAEPLSPPISRSSCAPNGQGGSTSGDDSNALPESQDVFAHGGVPWYFEPFDPVGTTIHEERYTGRAVLRDMSEELSDMDEDTLTELAPVGVEDAPHGQATAANGGVQTPARAEAIKKANKKKRGRRQHWSR